MVELIVLGSSASVPDAEHDTVSLALRGADWAVLIECGGSPIQKLAQLGVGLEDLRAVILSHQHPDHLYGLPALVQGLWIGGREASLPIYGPKQALDRARDLLELLELADREGMFAVEWHPVPLREGREVGSWGDIQCQCCARGSRRQRHAGPALREQGHRTDHRLFGRHRALSGSWFAWRRARTS